MATTYTPIRYPGGKTKLYPEIRAILEMNDLLGHPYAELFAGGAGLAIKLLLKGDVSSIVINDYDRAVYCMWDAIVNHAEEMCEFIDSAVLDIETWKKVRDMYQNHDGVGDFELGKAAFYLNRTNVSGILSGGVIGGLEQTGNYKMFMSSGRTYNQSATVVDEVEKSFGIDIKVASVGALGQTLTTAFNTKDPFGNPSIDLATVKSTSVLTSALFAITYNALNGDVQTACRGTDGKPLYFEFSNMSVTSAEQLAQMDGWDDASTGNWCATTDVVDGMLIIVNPDLTAEEINTYLGTLDFETLKSMMD